MAKFLDEIKAALKSNQTTDRHLAHICIRSVGLTLNNGDSGMAEVSEGLKVLLEGAPNQAKRAFRAISTITSEWKSDNGKVKYLPDTAAITIDSKTCEVSITGEPSKVYADFKARGITKDNMWLLLSSLKAESVERPKFTDEEFIKELQKKLDSLYKDSRMTEAQRVNMAENMYRANGLTVPARKTK